MLVCIHRLAGICSCNQSSADRQHRHTACTYGSQCSAGRANCWGAIAAQSEFMPLQDFILLFDVPWPSAPSPATCIDTASIIVTPRPQACASVPGPQGA